MLSQIMTKISGGVTFLGGVLIVFGLVNLGMTIKDGMQGGGGQLAGAIAMIVGGGIVIAASVFLGNLDTSFAVGTGSCYQEAWFGTNRSSAFRYHRTPDSA